MNFYMIKIDQVIFINFPCDLYFLFWILFHQNTFLNHLLGLLFIWFLLVHYPPHHPHLTNDTTLHYQINIVKQISYGLFLKLFYNLNEPFIHAFTFEL
jgi:hypothetical protein